MKKFIVATILLLSTCFAANACEICGCGLGNYYLGLLPQFNSKFIGLRYQYRSFNTTIAGDATQFSKDYYHTVELWSGWNIGKRWQLIAIIPFNTIHEVSDDGVTNRNGLGDIAVMVNYKLFDNRTHSNNKTISQQLWVGGGIKLATGRFNVDPNDPDLIALANTQTGTASTDFMFNTLYNIRINKFGVNTSASYKLNTDNRDKYEFGNKFSLNSIAYYSIPKKRFSIIPNAGLLYENTEVNTLQSKAVAQTGGYQLLSSAGVEFSFRKVTIGASTQLPLAQNFADGQTETKFKGLVHVTFTL